MNYLGAWLLGAAGGLLGAAIWAGIAYFFSYEVGWIAWAVGLLAGAGVVKGSGGYRSTTLGIAAVVITILALVGGKYAAAQFAVTREFDAFMESNREEGLASYELDAMVDKIVVEREAAGQTVDPEEVRIFDPELGQDVSYVEYPDEIYEEAFGRISELSAEEKTAAHAKFDRDLDAGLAAAKKEAFVESFAALDLLFFGLAILTAARLAGLGGQSDEAEDEEDDEDERA